MKFKSLKGVAYNLCDMVASGPFHYDSLQKEDLPEIGEWIIDLKNNSVSNGKEKPIRIKFMDKLHEWFLLELKKINGSSKNIDEAYLTLKFNFKERKPIEAYCDIKADKKFYSCSRKFRLF